MQASLERFYEGMGGAAMRVARALGLALGRDQQWLARHCEKGPSPPGLPRRAAGLPLAL